MEFWDEIVCVTEIEALVSLQERPKTQDPSTIVLCAAISMKARGSQLPS